MTQISIRTTKLITVTVKMALLKLTKVRTHFKIKCVTVQRN